MTLSSSGKSSERAGGAALNIGRDSATQRVRVVGDGVSAAGNHCADSWVGRLPGKGVDRAPESRDALPLVGRGAVGTDLAARADVRLAQARPRADATLLVCTTLFETLGGAAGEVRDSPRGPRSERLQRPGDADVSRQLGPISACDGFNRIPQVVDGVANGTDPRPFGAFGRDTSRSGISNCGLHQLHKGQRFVACGMVDSGEKFHVSKGGDAVAHIACRRR